MEQAALGRERILPLRDKGPWAWWWVRLGRAGPGLT